MDNTAEGTTLAAPVFTGQPGNMQNDLAALAAEMAAREAPLAPESQSVDAQPVQSEQPQTTATQTPPVEIPGKFKNADGTVSEEKIAKSTLSAEQMYEKYRQKELELQRQMNKVNQLKTGYQPPTQVQQVPVEPITDFEQQINNDLFLNQQNPGKVLAKLFAAAKEAAYQQARADMHEIRAESELSKRQRELEAIAAYDPEVLSEQMIDRLSQIRTERPWVNTSPQPWTSAYKEHLADTVLNQRVGQQVKMPNPKGATAPILPAAPIDRTQKSTVNLGNMTKDQAAAFLDSQSPEQQKAFFGQLGFNTDRWKK